MPEDNDNSQSIQENDNQESGDNSASEENQPSQEETNSNEPENQQSSESEAEKNSQDDSSTTTPPEEKLFTQQDIDKAIEKQLKRNKREEQKTVQFETGNNFSSKIPLLHPDTGQPLSKDDEVYADVYKEAENQRILKFNEGVQEQERQFVRNADEQNAILGAQIEDIVLNNTNLQKTLSKINDSGLRNTDIGELARYASNCSITDETGVETKGLLKNMVEWVDKNPDEWEDILSLPQVQQKSKMAQILYTKSSVKNKPASNQAAINTKPAGKTVINNDHLSPSRQFEAWEAEQFAAM